MDKALLDTQKSLSFLQNAVCNPGYHFPLLTGLTPQVQGVPFASAMHLSAMFKDQAVLVVFYHFCSFSLLFVILLSQQEITKNITLLFWFWKTCSVVFHFNSSVLHEQNKNGVFSQCLCL